MTARATSRTPAATPWAINYAAGTLHFMPDGSAPLPKPTYAWVTVGTKWVGNNQVAVQRWTMTGIEYHNTAYTFPMARGLGRGDLPQQQQCAGAKRHPDRPGAAH
ncbi:hypothetical protein [Aeromonas sp. FDAARGOS 1402]|uniref:hypothetical protein n=1 Tax=Aeromonas sp. FDAARGOS 1402 TaxID=2778051 RepID=UPI0020B4214F|nr:hypothetical protein [Aeromonas sp. FDAARGOS 1402]